MVVRVSDDAVVAFETFDDLFGEEFVDVLERICDEGEDSGLLGVGGGADVAAREEFDLFELV